MIRKKELPKRKRLPKGSPFAPEIRAEVRKLYVYQNQSPYQIAKQLNECPTHQTILNWIVRYKWDAERANYEQEIYENTSNKNMADKILEKINHILAIKTTSFTISDADALKKLVSTFREITDKKYQIPMIYQVLTDFLTFLKINEKYKSIVTEDLTSAVRDFKDSIIGGLQ